MLSDLVQMTWKNQYMKWMYWLVMRTMLIMCNSGLSVLLGMVFEIINFIGMFTFSLCSGCAVASKSSLSDSLKEESFPRLKNSWYFYIFLLLCFLLLNFLHFVPVHAFMYYFQYPILASCFTHHLFVQC